MNEIEVKIIEINKEEIIRKIESFGAKKVAEGEQTSWFFDFPDGRIRNSKESVRLREFKGKKFITLKKLVSNKSVKEEEETEVFISDLDAMKKIFSAFGLKQVDFVKGKRTEYKIRSVSFDIDEYEVIPCYMEIEAPTKKLVAEWIEKLGIKKEKVTPWGSKELWAHYGKEAYY
ncbi:MAG: class IV adenylate cyclase [archaeon]